MSRYTDLNPVAHAVYARIQPHSSLKPIAQAAILSAFYRLSAPVQIHDALEQLLDARLITQMVHTIEGTTETVYWPTGLQPIIAPTLEQIRMSAEPKNSKLARLILLHGPITGPDLAAIARDEGMNCPAKNIAGLLAGHLNRGDIIARKINGVTLYMTPTQADESADAGAHVMSAPASAKQIEAEIPVNESEDEAMPEPDAKLLALANGELSSQVEALKTQIHELKNDVAAANLIFEQIGQTLGVGSPVQIPDALAERERTLKSAIEFNTAAGDVLADLEELLDVGHRDELAPCITELLAAQATVSKPETVEPAGRLALLLIDAADLTEIEELDQYDAANAQQLALRSVEQGNAARAVVVRILGEAARSVEWKQAA